jgi:hypothetical protein
MNHLKDPRPRGSVGSYEAFQYRSCRFPRGRRVRYTRSRRMGHTTTQSTKTNNERTSPTSEDVVEPGGGHDHGEKTPRENTLERLFFSQGPNNTVQNHPTRTKLVARQHQYKITNTRPNSVATRYYNYCSVTRWLHCCQRSDSAVTRWLQQSISLSRSRWCS